MALPVRSETVLPGAGAGTAAHRPAPGAAIRIRERLLARWRRAARSRTLPAGLRAQLTLGRGELILAVGNGPDGSAALVATDRALLLRAGTNGWSRLGWELVAGADWDSAAGCLVITGSGGTAPPRTVVPLRGSGTLPELARERITHTRLGSWTVVPDGLQRVRAEARLRPVTGELLWIVSSPDGLDLGDPQVRRQIDQAIARLREELGIPRLSHGDTPSAL